MNMMTEKDVHEKIKKLQLWLRSENSIECIYRSSQFSEYLLKFSVQVLNELPYNKHMAGFVHDERTLILKLVFRLKYTNYPQVESLLEVLCRSLREDTLLNKGLIIKCFSVLVRKFSIETSTLEKIFSSMDAFVVEIINNIENKIRIRDSLLILSEVLTFLIFAFKNYSEFGKTLIPQLVGFLKKYIENKESMHIFISSEDLLLEFLAVTCKLLRLLNDSDMLKQSPLIPEICIFLLSCTPNNVPELRKEIFYQIQHVALNQKEFFKPYIDVIMNTNGFFTCRPVLAHGVNLAAILCVNFCENVSVERIMLLFESITDVFEQEIPQIDLFSEHVDGKNPEYNYGRTSTKRLIADALEKTIECFSLKRVPQPEQATFYRKIIPLIYGILSCTKNSLIINSVLKSFKMIIKSMASGAGNVIHNISFLNEFEINILKKIFWLCIKNATIIDDLKDIALVFVLFNEKIFTKIVTCNLKGFMMVDIEAIEILQVYLNLGPVTEPLLKSLYVFFIDVIKDTKDYVFKCAENEEEIMKKNEFLKKILFALFKVTVSLTDNKINSVLVYIKQIVPVLVNTSPNPLLFEILRDFFYIISSSHNKNNEILTILYENLPFIFKSLNFLLDLYPLSEIYVETILSLPTNLSVLIPYIKQLIHALNIGMRGSNRLRIFSLRFIDNCLESLRPEYIDEQIHQEMYEVVDNLFYLMQFEETRILAARILTKLKDKHRVFLTRQSYLTNNILPSSQTNISLHVLKRIEYISADDVLLTAIKFLRHGDLVPNFNEFKVPIVQFRKIKKIDVIPGDVLYNAFRIVKAFLSDSNIRCSQMVYEAVVGLIELENVTFIDELRVFISELFEKMLILNIHQQLKNNTTKWSSASNSDRISEKQECFTETLLPSDGNGAFCESLGHKIFSKNAVTEAKRLECCCNRAKIVYKMEDLLVDALVETTNTSISIEIQKKLPYYLFIKKYIQLCYCFDERKRRAGYVGLLHLLKHRDLEGIESYQSKILRALFTCVERNKFIVKDEVQSSVFVVLRKSLHDVYHETEVIFVNNLANSNGDIRDISQAALEYLCEIRGITASELLAAHKDMILRNTLELQQKSNISGILENLSFVFLFRPPIIDLDKNFYEFINFVLRMITRPELQQSILRFFSAICTIVSEKTHLYQIINVFISSIDSEISRKALKQLFSYMPETESMYNEICSTFVNECINTSDDKKIRKLRLLLETRSDYITTLLAQHNQVAHFLKIDTVDSLYILSFFKLPEESLLRFVKVLLSTPPDEEILRNLLKNNTTIYHLFFTNLNVAFDHCQLLYRIPAVETALSKRAILPRRPCSLLFMNPTENDVKTNNLRIGDLFIKKQLNTDLQYVVDKNVVLKSTFNNWTEETLIEYFSRCIDEMDYNNPFEVFFYTFKNGKPDSNDSKCADIIASDDNAKDSSGDVSQSVKCDINVLILGEYFDEQKHKIDSNVLERNIHVFRNATNGFFRTQFVFYSYLSEYKNDEIIEYCYNNESEFTSTCYLSLFSPKKEYFSILLNTPTEYKRYVFKALDNLTRTFDLKHEICNFLSIDIFYKTHLFIIYPLIIKNEILNDDIVFELSDAVCRLFGTYIKVHQKVAIGLLLVINNYVMSKKNKYDLLDKEKAANGSEQDVYVHTTDNAESDKTEKQNRDVFNAQISTLSSLYSLYFSNCAHSTDSTFLKFQKYFTVPLKVSCLSINLKNLNILNFITLLTNELRKKNIELDAKEKLFGTINNITSFIFCDKFSEELKGLICFMSDEWLLNILARLTEEFVNHTVIFVLLEYLLGRKNELDEKDATLENMDTNSGEQTKKHSAFSNNLVILASNYCKMVCKLPNFNYMAIIKLLNNHGILPPEVLLKNEKIADDLDLLLLGYENKKAIDGNILKGFKARKELRELFFGFVVKSGICLNYGTDIFAYLRVLMIKNQCLLFIGNEDVTDDILDMMFYDDELLFYLKKDLMAFMGEEKKDIKLNYIDYRNYEITDDVFDSDHDSDMDGSTNGPVTLFNVYSSKSNKRFAQLYAPANNDSDYYYAEQRLGAKYKETENVLKMIQFDDFINAQKTLEVINKELPYDEDEAAIWEHEWIECAKELEQWDLIQEIGVMKNDVNLVIEALWKTSNLSLEEERNVLLRLVKESNKNLSQIVSTFLVNDELAYNRLVTRNIQKLVMYRDKHFLNNLQVTLEMRDESVKKDKLPMYFEGFREWSHLMTLRNHSNILSGTIKSFHELAKNYNLMGRICYENEHYDVAQHVITKIFALSNIEVVDAYEKIETDLMIYTKCNPQIGIELINIANLNYFTAAQKSRLFNLKAQLISDQKEANKFFLQSVQLADLSENWYSWAIFLKETIDLSKKENIRQMFSAFLQSNSKHGIIVLLNNMKNYNFDLLKQNINNLDMKEFLFYIVNLVDMLKTEDHHCASALIERMLMVGAQDVYLELMRASTCTNGDGSTRMTVQNVPDKKNARISKTSKKNASLRTSPKEDVFEPFSIDTYTKELEKIMQLAKNKYSLMIYSLEQLLSVLKIALEPRKEVKFYRILDTAFNMALNILFGYDGDVSYLKSQIRRIAIALGNDEFISDFYKNELSMKEITLLLFYWKNKFKGYCNIEKDIKMKYLSMLNDNFSHLEVFCLNNSLCDVFYNKPQIVGFEPSVKNNIIIHGDDGKSYHYNFIYNLPELYRKEEYLLQAASILDYFMKDCVHLKRRDVKLYSRKGVVLYNNTRLENMQDSYVSFDSIMEMYGTKDKVILEYLEIVQKYERNKINDQSSSLKEEKRQGIPQKSPEISHDESICNLEMRVKETVIDTSNKVKLDAFMTMYKNMGNKILTRYVGQVFRRDREHYLFKKAFLNSFSIDSFFLYFFFVEPKQPDQCALGLRKASLYQSNCFSKMNCGNSMLIRLTPNLQEYFGKINIEGRFLSIGHFFSKWLLNSKYLDDIIALSTNCNPVEVRERMMTVSDMGKILSECCDPEKLCQVNPLWHPWF